MILTLAGLALICAIGAVVFIQFGAMIEMFEQIRQMRIYLDMVDKPTVLDLGASQGRLASGAGLPANLDAVPRALVLFLSNKCETCRTLAAALDGGALPPHLWVVVVPVLSGDASQFLEDFRLYGDRILVDADHAITDAIGLDITPAAIALEAGRMVEAHTVPTVRQLYASLPMVERKRALARKQVREPDLVVVATPSDAR